MEHSRASGISHSTVTAGLFVAALLSVGIWQIVHAMSAKNTTPSVATTVQSASADASNVQAIIDATNSDPVAAVSANALGELVGAYTGLQQEGAYSTTTGAQIAGSIGQGLQAPVVYTQFSVSDLKIATDTSYAGMMQYRAGLQTSLKPLLANTSPEYEIFGMYVETKQTTYLDQLHAAAQNYRAAASSTALVAVPSDAIPVQLGLLNSMEEFASTLDSLANHAQDPIASSVLLENYNQAETDVLNAFQALVTYEQSKHQ